VRRNALFDVVALRNRFFRTVVPYQHYQQQLQHMFYRSLLKYCAITDRMSA